MRVRCVYCRTQYDEIEVHFCPDAVVKVDALPSLLKPTTKPPPLQPSLQSRPSLLAEELDMLRDAVKQKNQLIDELNLRVDTLTERLARESLKESK